MEIVDECRRLLYSATRCFRGLLFASLDTCSAAAAFAASLLPSTTASLTLPVSGLLPLPRLA